jgi:hypothetical protein
VNHRHLLPNEFDLLLDEEVGFGVAPLRAHLRECAECRVQLEEARTVFDALESAPHFAPSFDFADRVMAQVPVFVPWHVAARDAVQRWLPASRPARVVSLTVASAVAAMLTLAMLFVVSRPDMLVFASGVLGDRIPVLVGGAARELAVGILGAQAFTAIQHSGIVGIVIGAGGCLIAAAVALIGLEAAAAANRNRA